MILVMFFPISAPAPSQATGLTKVISGGLLTCYAEFKEEFQRLG